MVNRFIGCKTAVQYPLGGFFIFAPFELFIYRPAKKYELNDTLEVKAMNIDIPQQTVVFVPL